MTPDPNSVREYQDSLYSLYEQAANTFRRLIEDLLRSEAVDAAQIEHRAKTADSVREKINRKQYENPLSEITDLAGVRVILYHASDVQPVIDLLRRQFSVDEENSTDKADELAVDAFGYRSVHVVVELSEARATLPEYRRVAGLKVEVQVRTVLQHAWAAISHKLDYKSVGSAPKLVRRSLFRLSALLELADSQFDEIRAQLTEITDEYREGVKRGVLDIDLNVESLREWVSNGLDTDSLIDDAVRAGAKKSSQATNPVGDTYERLLKVATELGLRTVLQLDEEFSRIRGKLEKAVGHLVADGSVNFYAVPPDLVTLTLICEHAAKLKDNLSGLNWKPSISDRLGVILGG